MTQVAGSTSDTSSSVIGTNTGSWPGGYGLCGTSSNNHGVCGSSSGGGVAGVSGSGYYGVKGVPTASYGTGVWGDCAGVTYANGVCGSASSSTSFGVYGVNPAGNGVKGQSESIYDSGVWGNNVTSGYGVSGSAINGTGVWGNSNSGGIGVKGTAAIAVWGDGNVAVKGTSGANYGYGGAFYSYGTYAYAVYGNCNGSTGAKAGYFVGNVDVIGTLYKSAGSFKIDHPLDPENKYLIHSFVESDEMKNVYDGIATCDANGEAVVTFPKWFEALNDKFRYVLTAVGCSMPDLFIKEKVNNGQFVIAGGKEGCEVSWQVTGVRKDAFALANPMDVEVDKEDIFKGTYLHARAHGQDSEKCHTKVNKENKE